MDLSYLTPAVLTLIAAVVLYEIITECRKSKRAEAAKRKIPKVMLWTAPRCVSTAFERAIIEMPNGKIFHEPFSIPYYFGPQKISSRYKEEGGDSTTYADTAKELTKPYEEDENTDFVFAKDMAYYVTHYKPHWYYSYLLSTILSPKSSFIHTFLIRRPDKVIVSLYKASLDEDLTGWNYFDAKEIGFDALYMIYQRCMQLGFKDAHGGNLVIVDADDLLADPGKILKMYCDRVGLEYSDNILTWKPGMIEQFEFWGGWHDAVIKSSGFTTKTKEQIEAKEKKLKEFIETKAPKQVQEEIAKAFKIYNELYAKRIH